jgi:hypothetical protein
MEFLYRKNQTLFEIDLRLFYKTKSIEISCPIVPKHLPPAALVGGKGGAENECCAKQATDPTLDSNQEYLVSDTSSGRYYTCYSLDRRSVCVEAIFYFETKTLN